MLILLSGIASAAGTLIATGSSTDLRIEILRYEPSPAEPGTIMDLWVKVSTVGNEISELATLNDVKLELVNEFPFYAVSEEEGVKKFGSMEPGETRTIRYRVNVDSNAKPGTNEVRFKFTSATQKDGLVSAPMEIEVQSVSATIAVESVISEPEEIPAGEKASLIIKLRNDALSSLRDISAKLDLTSASVPFSPIHSTTEKKVRLLGPGETVDIKYDILALADAAADVYKIPFSLNYYDDAGNVYSKNDTIGLIVSAKPDLKVGLEDFDTFQPGKSGNIVISVSNVGPSDIKFMTLQLAESNGYTILSKVQEYLGNLESDDFETAEFKINVDSEVAGDLPVKVVMDYRDAYNNKKIEEVTLKLPVYSEKEIRAYDLDGNLKNYYMPIVYILAILFLYFAIKDWRKHRALDSAIKGGFEGIFLTIFRIIFILRWRNLKRVPRKVKLFFQKL